MKQLAQKYRLLAIGILIGVIYGLLTRLLFDQQATLASITYLFFIPTVLGIIPLVFADEEQLKSYRNLIFIPWLCVLTFFLTMRWLGIEDLLCLLILGVPFFVLGTLGALVFKLIKLYRQKKKNTLLALFLLPFLFAPLEEMLHTPSQEYQVVSEVLVQASPEEIWPQIIRVPEIAESEYKAGMFNKLGIPRPMEATLTREEIGGQRVGFFEGGLRFYETIQVWEPYQRVAFDIALDLETVRPKVFDQHVLQGNYFKFVNASYELERKEEGSTLLRLTSGYSLSSKVNFYGKFWGDWILGDFQDRLLEVVKHRCEGR